MMVLKIILIVALHFIGAIITLIIHCKDGTLEYAAIYGDGIRTATPADIVFFDFVLWEFCLVLCISFLIEEILNDYFRKKYDKKGLKKE